MTELTVSLAKQVVLEHAYTQPPESAAGETGRFCRGFCRVLHSIQTPPATEVT